MWKIDKTGKVTKIVEAKDFPETIEFLNDVAASKDGASVYVTEMSNPGPMFEEPATRTLWAVDSDEAKQLPKKGCVYKITLKGEISVAIPPGSMEIRFPNGVTVEEDLKDDKLFVGDFFTGNVYSYADKKFTQVATGLRGVDGLTVTKDTIYASSWNQGKVWKVDRKTKESKVILEDLTTAADFFYDAKGKQLIIPDMLAGKLVFLKLD
jgi:sugar lactone lactonase YvrE